jgi:hypothetical protein
MGYDRMQQDFFVNRVDHVKSFFAAGLAQINKSQ